MDIFHGDDERQDAHREVLRRTPAWYKLELVARMNERVRRMGLARLRHRYPDETSPRLRRRLADMVLGEELATSVYGPLPAERGDAS